MVVVVGRSGEDEDDSWTRCDGEKRESGGGGLQSTGGGKWLQLAKTA